VSSEKTSNLKLHRWKASDGMIWGEWNENNQIVDERIGGKAKEDFGLKNIAGQIYDNFDKTDIVLNGSKSLSGHTWMVSGPGMSIAKVKNGALISDGSNFYATLDYGQPLKFIHASYSFKDVGGTSGIVDNVVIIMHGSPFDLSNLIHLICSTNSMTIDKRIGFTWVHIPLSIDYDTSLKSDGTVYTSSMILDGNKLTIIDALGRKFDYVDDDFLTINPTKATYQIGPQPTSQYQGRFHTVAAGEKGFIAPKHDVAMMKDLLPLRDDIKWFYGGTSAVKRQRHVDKVVTQNGWLNVAKSASYGGNIMDGTVKINAKDAAGRTSLIVLLINNRSISVLNSSFLVGGAITKVRIRAVSGINYLDLYMPSAATNAVTFTADYEGFLTLVTPIATDDTGATAANTLTVNTYPVPRRLSFSPTANDFYTIAAQVSAAFGFAMSGRAQIEAYNSLGYCLFDVLFHQTSILTVSNVIKKNVSPVTSMRATTDASNMHLDIQFSNAATYSTTVNVCFSELGQYNPSTSPAVGAALTNVLSATV